MPDDAFRPLTVETMPGKHRTLWTVDDLGEILFSWPAGKRRTRAILAFVAAKDGTGPAEKARQAFLDAAREAGAIVKEGEFPFKRPKPMIPARVKWVRIGDLDPTMKGELHHFIALDEDDRDVGIVRRIEFGSETGWWMWSMTRVHPGTPLNVLRSGTTETRGEAAKALVECWRAFRKYYGLED